MSRYKQPSQTKIERLWVIRRDILNLVAEAEGIIAGRPEVMMSSPNHKTLHTIAKLEKREGMNKTFTVEQRWEGDKGQSFDLNVGVIIRSERR